MTRSEVRATGLTIGVRSRDVIPALLRALHEAGIAVYGAQLREASMEDVYFALEQSFVTEGITTAGRGS